MSAVDTVTAFGNAEPAAASSVPIQASFNILSPDAWLSAAFSVAGYDKSQWRWINGQSYLSTWQIVGLGAAGYLGTIFGIQFLMQSRKGFKLKRFTQIYNMFLTVASLALLVLFVEEVIPIVKEGGLFYSVCDKRARTQRLEVLNYLNYLTKWLEFTDTVVLALKKKPLKFLHVFHHTMTMILCFTQMNDPTPLSWLAITLNLLVHVIMYYYFFLASCGIYSWWKKYVTVVQIIQFIIDLGFIYFCIYQIIAWRYFPKVLPCYGDCVATKRSAVFGSTLFSSYLVLFVQFYQRTYLNKQTANNKQKTQ
ncbi:Fatty acyl-CoA elongase/Polyunsaturated fatty acid specific elongation enzyme [Coemansia sp. RSA 2607]|nr:Fatty acyl-CoA elongase/Polyunsaturated fatty acid specific elongation enzyme [Coemansia sp. RSA 2607]KAJ2389756.1 Fatty acyl-CoA elongase/Polyunsaturated fatty acid specific elongation enzyme [Coemansia sp. RSA 2603]